MKLGMVGPSTKISGGVIAATLVLALFALTDSEMFWSDDSEDQIPLVKADPTPIKRRPVDPGGMEIPFQNFEIWSILEGER